MDRLRIGTRGSRLALRQTEIVCRKLEESYPQLELEVVEIKTTGDKFLDVSLDKIGGKGLFIKEIEEALVKGEIDLAVHSLKDMPAEIHEGLVIAAYTEREDASDCFISRENITLEKLPHGAVIGTSSLRRKCQLKAMRPDLEFKPLRGNILTRIRKLDEGDFDAIVLASAGLIRLGLEDRIAQRFSLEQFVPAVCQGIIGIEVRKEDEEIITLLKALDNKASRIAAECERAFLKQMDGNCQVPLGAYCQVYGEEIHVTGIFGDNESGKVYREFMSGSSDMAQELGRSLAISLKSTVI